MCCRLIFYSLKIRIKNNKGVRFRLCTPFIRANLEIQKKSQDGEYVRTGYNIKCHGR